MFLTTMIEERLRREHLIRQGRQWMANATEDELEQAVNAWYRLAAGKEVDFAHPRTFNDRIQWLKAHDLDPRKALCSDKIGVRDYVASVAGEDVLLKQYGVWERAEEVDFEGIERPFMFKPNHTSGDRLFVDESVDVRKARKKAKAWLDKDFAVMCLERHYTFIQPKVFAEEYLDDIVFEYQAWCFKGEVAFIAAIVEPHGVNQKQFFTPEWEREPFVSSQPIYEGTVERPTCLDSIIDYSTQLADDFSHVRVDWYWSKSKGLKFSEMTFTPAAGNIGWYPEEYNEKLAHLIEIPGVS